MTCKDCIHYEVCENGQWYETPCVYYKNKADFVKVVRCKDCKYCEKAVSIKNTYFCVVGSNALLGAIIKKTIKGMSKITIERIV